MFCLSSSSELTSFKWIVPIDIFSSVLPSHVIGFSDLFDLWVIKIKKSMILWACEWREPEPQITPREHMKGLFITRVVRHRVLKWARFYFLGVDFQSYADWLVRRQYVINVIWWRTKCGREKCALLAQLGSMECLLECLYHFIQRHTPAVVDQN